MVHRAHILLVIGLFALLGLLSGFLCWLWLLFLLEIGLSWLLKLMDGVLLRAVVVLIADFVAHFSVIRSKFDFMSANLMVTVSTTLMGGIVVLTISLVTVAVASESVLNAMDTMDAVVGAELVGASDVMIDTTMVLSHVAVSTFVKSSVVVSTVLVIMFVLIVTRVGVEVSSTDSMLTSLVHSGVLHIVVLNTVFSALLELMEQLVVLMLDIVHKAGATVIINIMAVGVSSIATIVGVVSVVLIDMAVKMMTELEVTTVVGVLRHVSVLVMVGPVGHSVVFPVIRVVLNAMSVVVLVNMLRVVLTIVHVGVVVTHVVGALWLNIVVSAVLFACEVTLIMEVRHMILQVPVALREVSIGMVLVAGHKLAHLVLSLWVLVLEWRLLVNEMIVHSEVLFALGLVSLLLWLLVLALLLLVVHLTVEERGLRSHVLLSLSLGLRRLAVVVRVNMVRILRDGGVVLVAGVLG